LTELVARPANGRVYTGTRAVRLGDVSPKGRVRLDAVARYLQDVANDDGTEVIGEDAMAWVLRRVAIEVTQFPVLREPLSVATWASGVGSRWAERRTSIEGERGGRIEAAALWVHVDLATGRPKKLTRENFGAFYLEATAGREVNARLHHPDLPPVADERTLWHPRFADFDVLGHVNNAIYLAMVEEALEVAAGDTIEVEFRGGIDRGQQVELVRAGDSLWVTASGTLAATVVVTRSSPSQGS
jgi:acyl-ACP thioesterase